MYNTVSVDLKQGVNYLKKRKKGREMTYEMVLLMSVRAGGETLPVTGSFAILASGAPTGGEELNGVLSVRNQL